MKLGTRKDSHKGFKLCFLQLLTYNIFIFGKSKKEMCRASNKEKFQKKILTIFLLNTYVRHFFEVEIVC